MFPMTKLSFNMVTAELGLRNNRCFEEDSLFYLIQISASNEVLSTLCCFCKCILTSAVAFSFKRVFYFFSS